MKTSTCILFSAAALAATCLAAPDAGAESLRLHLGEADGNRATARAFRIGLDGYVGTVPDAAGGHELIAPGSLHLAFTLSDHLAIGLGSIGVANADNVEGERWAIGAGPFVEGFTFLGERLQPFAQVGVPMQWRFAGEADDAFGIAPYASAGARYWLTDWFTLGAESRLHVVASEGYLLQRRILPQGALAWTAGLNLDFHF
ncbi:hypothetical protein [Vulgatibacter sp.]|uniref:hypothetical protein n=1 Tax=Vulgatibacter sp. TaxID=1971226 RepID=UPI003565B1CC